MDDTAVEAELDCVQEGALLAPFALRVLEITGKDRATWLNGLVTCDVAKLAVGDGAYGLLAQRNGKVMAEIFVALLEDKIAVALPADRADALLEHLDRHLIMEDVTLRFDDARDAAVALGRQAPALVTVARERGGYAGAFQRGGLPAAVFMLPKDAAGGASGVVGAISPSGSASPAGWNRVRIEHGITAWGVDFDETNYPQEASLEKDAVSFEKGCYLGQEAVFMMEKRGHVSKRIVQLVFKNDVAVGARILTDEKKDIGFVTSVASRPGPKLALGWVKYKFAKADTELWVGDERATVTALLAIGAEPE